MNRYRVLVTAQNGDVLHDTTLSYASKNGVALCWRLTRNMEKRYAGKWHCIEVSLAA